MLALKQAIADMSPYVRKHACHAIPKLYVLDASTRDELLEALERLLNDSSTLVIGSAVMAFERLCPERLDLIHPQYKKLCTLLVDVDEWGQIIILNLLLRYARTQFLDPNRSDVTVINGTSESEFYAGEKKGGKEDEEDEEEAGVDTYVMDPDHRLLLRSAQPLLQSRNPGVVLAVAQVFHYLAPASEVRWRAVSLVPGVCGRDAELALLLQAGVVGRALVRLLRSHREIQYVALHCIATMSATRPSMFEPHLKTFFVSAMDPLFVRELKLEARRRSPCVCPLRGG